MNAIKLVIFAAFLVPCPLISQRSDSIQITLERICTGFGHFTEYRLTINGDGLLIHEDKEDSCGFFRMHAPIVEKARTHIPKSTVDSLVQEFFDIDYFSLEDSYDSKIVRSAPGEPPSISISTASDLHTCVTSLKIDNRRKRVVNRIGAPPELSMIEAKIDSLAGMPEFDRDMKRQSK
jgi:hypothetical protein